MNKMLDSKGLTYYSQKIKKYITDIIEPIKGSLSDINSAVTSSNEELNKKIDCNSIKIDTNKDGISDLSDKYDALKEQVDGTILECDGHPEGDTINVNSVEQFVFRDVKAGQVIEIPNKSGETDFMVECYTDLGAESEIVHRVIALNENTKDSFIYDDRFVEVTPTGVRPRDTIELNYSQYKEEVDGIEYTISISDVIPEELLNGLHTIVNVREE